MYDFFNLPPPPKSAIQLKQDKYKARFADISQKLSKEEAFALILDFLYSEPHWPRQPNAAYYTPSNLERAEGLKIVESWYRFWFFAHYLGAYDNLGYSETTILTSPYWYTSANIQVGDIFKQQLAENYITYDKLALEKAGFTLATATQQQVYDLKQKIIPQAMVEWVTKLDEIDLSVYQELIRGRRIRSQEDNYVLGIRQDVFAAALEVGVTAAIVVGGGYAIAGAIAAPAAGSAVSGSAFQVSTYAGSLSAAEAATVTTFSAAEIAAVGGGVTAAQVGTGAGILATIQGLVPAGAIETASAGLVASATQAVKDFLQPKQGENATISEVASHNKNGLLIAGAIVSAILLLI